MHKSQRKMIAVVGLVLACLALAGCPPRIKIADINRDPGRYTGKEISVAGEVSGSFGALGTGVYQVNDGTGSIWVYSQGFGVPNNGARVAVTGTLSQGFSFGGRNFATILRQSEKRH